MNQEGQLFSKMGQRQGRDTAIEVRVLFRRAPPTPGQAAAFRRLWQILLEDRGAAPKTLHDRASAQSEGAGDGTAIPGIGNDQLRGEESQDSFTGQERKGQSKE